MMIDRGAGGGMGGLRSVVPLIGSRRMKTIFAVTKSTHRLIKGYCI